MSKTQPQLSLSEKTRAALSGLSLTRSAAPAQRLDVPAIAGVQPTLAPR